MLPVKNYYQPAELEAFKRIVKDIIEQTCAEQIKENQELLAAALEREKEITRRQDMLERCLSSCQTCQRCNKRLNKIRAKCGQVTMKKSNLQYDSEMPQINEDENDEKTTESMDEDSTKDEEKQQIIQQTELEQQQQRQQDDFELICID